MSTWAQRSILRAALCATVIACTAPNLLPAARAQEASTYDDPFYKLKGESNVSQLQRGTTFFGVTESIDPFTGNLSLVHTDIHLPGNGGFDLLIRRSYNSRIWGRRDVSNPGLVALNERSVLGLGWSLHFGRVRNPRGTGSANRLVPDNSIVEMPDGSQQILYRDRTDTTRFVTRDLWQYRMLAGSPLRYELTINDGTVYIFSQAARYVTSDGQEIYQVASITTPSGNTMTFTYDSADARLLRAITDTTGRVITFSYSTVTGGACGYDRLDSINVNGRSYRYDYSLVDCVLLLTRVTPPVGPAWTYRYRGANPGLNQLETITYPSGGTITYSYGNVQFDVGTTNIPFSVVTRRVTGGRDIAAGTWDYAYSAVGGQPQTTTITRPGCGVERHTFASFSSLPNSGQVPMWRIGLPLKREVLTGTAVVRAEEYSWSASSAISDDDVGSGAWNGTTGFLYESQVFSARLSSVSIRQDGASYVTTYNSYDTFGNPTSVTDTGNVARQTSMSYFTNATRNMVRGRPRSLDVTVASDTFNQTFTYNASGNVTQRRRNGVSTSYGYSSGNLISETDALGRTTSYLYSNGVVQKTSRPLATIARTINEEGLIRTETDGTGSTTSFSYDGTGRLTGISPALGASVSISYASDGSSRQISRGGTTITEMFDGFGRPIGTRRSQNLESSRTFDACGRVAFESYLYSGTRAGDSRSYDVLGRVLQETRPDGSSVRYAYSADGVATTDEGGATTTRRYQTFGKPEDRRLVGVTDAVGTTSVAYNGAGSVTRITQPGGYTHSYTRDAHDFLISETHPATGTVTYARDSVGNATSRTDAVGSQSLQYDAHDRLTRISNGASSATFAYDANDRRISATTPVTSETWAYDEGGRLQRHAVMVGGNTFQTAYAYDLRGNATSITYPTGRTVTLQFDLADRTTRIANFVNSVTYHASGKPSTIVLANGRSVSRTFNNRYQTQTITSSGILNLAYTHSPVGNITRVTDGIVAGRNQTLAYDSTHRLSSAAGVWGSMTLAYDALGNRLSRTVDGATTSYAYDSGRRVTSTSGAETLAFAYDAAGRISNTTGTAISYNQLSGCLATVGNLVTYDCDSDGRILRQTNAAAGSVSVFHHDQWGQLIAETKADGTPVVEYVYLNRELVAAIEPVASAGSITLTAPSAGASVSGSSVLLGASAGSPDGIASVSFRLDGSPIGTPISTPPYQMSWNSLATSNGNHLISATATTGSGGLLIAPAVSVTVANANPVSVQIATPATGATVSGGAVAIAATASSSDGIAGVTLRLDGTALASEITAPPYQLVWDSTSTLDGSHQIFAVARSNTGALATASVNVTVANAGSSLWTWMTGSSGLRQIATYGTKGVPAPTNDPGARYGGAGFTRVGSELWLFGGLGITGHLNDLWRYDGSNWTWVSGSSSANEVGRYGTKGVAAGSNVPGARRSSVSWTDSEGNLWLYGGRNGALLFNDLWKFDGSNWTWVAGSSSTNQPGVYGTKGVSSASNVPGARWGATGWRDSAGRLWLFGGTGVSGRHNDLWRFDGNTWTWIAGSSAVNQSSVYGMKGVAAGNNVPGAKYDASGWIDSSDRLWLFGGHTIVAGRGGMSNDLWKFDGANWTWVSGSSSLNQQGSYGSQGVATSSSVPGARYGAVSWRDAGGNLWLFGGDGPPGGNGGSFNDIWKFDGVNWTWIAGSTLINQPGQYGVRGVPAASNVPGARTWASAWRDASGRLWLYGGYSYADESVSSSGDLWVWN